MNTKQTSMNLNDAFVDTLIQDFLKKSQLPGISITVNSRGKLIYSKGFGYADIENKIKMLPTTQTRTASVSKVITATALGKLATEGKLDLDAPVVRYIPYLKPPFAQLTTRQLAGHTAGLQHRPARGSARKKEYTSTKALVQLVEDTELKFEPDTDYQYSTLAYNLLAGVIEGASGKSYTDYMQENIFEPLGMSQTFPDKKSELSTNDAQMYYFKDEKLVKDHKFFNGSYKLPGAGFRSTSEDLAKMMNAYANGFLSEEVVEEMFTSNILKNGQKTQVGLGWRINQDMNQYPTIEHAGNWQGARTVIVYYPKEQLTLSLMVNAQCVLFIEETAQIIAQLFLHQRKPKTNLKGLKRSLKITHNKPGEAPESLNGQLHFDRPQAGRLVMDIEIKFLQDNTIFSLGIGNHYALSTAFGLIYLNLKTSPSLKGKLFLYQLLNDPYHLKKTPFLQIESKP